MGTAPLAWSACVGGSGGGSARAGPDVPGAIGVVDSVTSSSMCVNGLEIHFDQGMPVTVNGRPATAQQLAPGQVVAVETQSASGRLAAQNIAVLRVLEGPVTRVDGDAQTVFVMGQPVRVTDETRSPARGPELDMLTPGSTVQVSGYRNARGEVVASRLDVAPPGEHSAIGRLRQRDSRSGEIGSLPVTFAGMRPGGERDVLVRGRWDGESLRAGTVVEDPSARVLAGGERAVVESLVVEPRRGDTLRVGRLQVRITRATRIDGAVNGLRVDQRVRVTGVPDQRRGFAAERIEVPPSGQRASEVVADRRPAAPSERERDETQRADNADAGRPERTERLERSEPARVERTEAARVERTEPARVERTEPARVERTEPVRVERPERRERDDARRIERAERSDRSGSNSGRN